MIRKRRSLFAALLLALAFFAAGCAPQAGTAPAGEAQPTAVSSSPTPTAEPSPGPLSLTDGLGRQVALPAPAQRVVSLAPSNTEILFAIGAGEQVVGRDEFSDFPPEAANLPSVGGGFGDFNNEAIVELQPDLVLAAELNPPELVAALEQLGLTVYYLPNPTSLEELYENMLTVATLTGRAAAAQQQIEALAARVVEIESRLAGASRRPKVFYELDSTDPNAPWTAGPGSFIDTLIRLASGENVAGDLEGEYLQLSIEELVVRDPEIILLGDAAYGVTPESLAARAGWEGLTAVKEGKILPFDDDLVSRPGPRLVEGLETLAKLIHPEVFP